MRTALIHVDSRVTTDWDLLQGMPGLQLSLFLPGNLPHNFTELNEATCDMTYAQIVAQLFRSKEIPFEKLTERDWLCVICVKDFIEHHFCQWWLDNKDGSTIVSTIRIVCVLTRFCS